MTLSSIISIANSGLRTAERAMNVVSDNIANVNTPGYVRKIAEQVPVAQNLDGGGVMISQIARAANRFLQQASLGAQADSGSADIQSSYYDQAQSLFGDPSSDTSFFSGLDNIFSAFGALAASPSATMSSQALSQVSDFFNSASSIDSGLKSLSTQADSQISSDVEQANQLLSQINQLNDEISRATVAGKDTTGSQNQQSALVDQLSKLMDVQVSARTPAGVTVRASDGLLLAGDGAATLRYDTSGPTGQLMVTPPGGSEQAYGSRLTSGELEGLLSFRNTGLPGLTNQLSELTSQAATRLNAVSNSYSSVPAASRLTGRNTGLDIDTAVSGFSGKTTVAIVDSTGTVQRKVDIDFTAGTMTVNGAATSSAFTPSSFLATLNTALGGSGSAGFVNGALSISAAGSNGVAIGDDTTNPSSKAGQGFSAFFGLNDIVRSSTMSNYNTGLKLTDPNGFTPGQTITLRLSGPDGASIRDVTVAVPSSGTTMGDLIGALNSPSTGVGLYGSFGLDGNGQMSFTPASGSNVGLSVVADKTSRGTGGPSISQLFGVGDGVRSLRTSSFSIRSDIAQSPSKLPMAQLNVTAAVGSFGLAAGDTRGADALSLAGQTLVQFGGAAGPVSMTLSDYAASFGGSVGRQAAQADTAKTNADAVASEAQTRRSSAEGVNLDEELVNLTTYQQAYSASARMIQAAKDMYDTLLNMVQ